MRKIHKSNFTNRWLLLLLVGLSGSISLSAQDKILKLRAPKQPVNTRFSQVLVMDHRPDTTNIGLSITGYPIRFNTIVSLYIKRYIDSAIHPDGNRTVLIDLKKLAFNPGRHWISDNLSADIYLQKNDSLWTLIASVDKSYKVRKSYTNSTAQMLKALIDIIDYRLGSGLAANSPSFSLQQINEGHLAVSQSYPILNPNRLSYRGYYPNFKKFREDSIIHSEYRLEYQKDSVYHLSDLPFTGKIADTLFNKIWVISDKEGRMYIRLIKGIFVPLVKKDNTFSFYIPHSLPDMHSIQRVAAREKSMDWNFTGFDFSGINTGNSNNLLIIPITIAGILVLDLAFFSTAALITHSQIKKITASGKKFGKFRDCFIDMNSGHIVYY